MNFPGSQLFSKASLAEHVLLALAAFSLPVARAAGADYEAAVLADSPVGYWRLGDSAGPTVHDLVGGHDATAVGVVFGRPGALSNDVNTACAFNIYTSSHITVPSFPELNPPRVSLECWARCTAPIGVGWCSQATITL